MSGLKSKVGSFALRTTTGNQSITGLGFQPKVVLFWLTNRTSDGGQLSHDFSFGVGISSSDRRCGYFQRSSGNNVQTPAGIDSSKILKFLNSSAVATVAADMVSMDSDGFTINLGTTNGSAYIVNYMALGGDEITNAKGGKFQSPAPGNIDITDVGFSPDLLLLFHVRLSATDPNPSADSTATSPRVMIGFGNKDMEQAVMSSASRSNNNQAGSMQLSNAIFYTQGVDPTTIANTATLTAMLANGFRLNFSVAATQTAYTFYVAIKGGRYKIGATNQRTTTGTTTIGSLAFKPQSILMRSFSNVATTSLISHAKDSLGAADRAGNHAHLFNGMLTATNPNLSSVDLDRTAVIKMMTPANPPSLQAEAVVSAWGDNSVTLDWTTVDGTAREAIYLISGSSDYYTTFDTEITGAQAIDTEFGTEITGVPYTDEFDTELSGAEAITTEFATEISGLKSVNELPTEVTGAEQIATEFAVEVVGAGYTSEFPTEILGAGYNTEILTELQGKQLISDEVLTEILGGRRFTEFDTELTGSKPATFILTEITGARRSSEFDTEVTGIPYSNEFPTELYGGQQISTELDTQIMGKRFIPLQRTYRIIVKDADGTPIGEFHNFRNLKFGKRLNNFGEASFEVPANDPKVGELVNLRKYTVWIYMQEDAGMTLVWAGEQAARMGNLENSGNNWCEIYCFDWLEQLNSRYTPFEVVYEQVDAGAIAVDLIEKTQDGWDEYGEPYGDLGITIGEVEETIDRDKTFVNQNIMEAIISLSDVLSGFDFEITHEKVFNLKSIIGEDRTDEIVLEYGVNIDSAKVQEDFTHPSNRAIVLGPVIGEETLQRIERNDSSSQEQYGLREFITSETEESELANFQDRGDAINAKYGVPLVKIDATLVKGSNPSITQFGVGDVVWVKIKSGVYNISEQYRIFEWNLTFDTNNAEQLVLTLAKFTIA